MEVAPKQFRGQRGHGENNRYRETRDNCKCLEDISDILKQAGAELGQAQLKQRVDLTPSLIALAE